MEPAAGTRLVTRKLSHFFAAQSVPAPRALRQRATDARAVWKPIMRTSSSFATSGRSAKRRKREAKEAREELARQVAEGNRTAGWGNRGQDSSPVREAGSDRIYIWRSYLSNRSVDIRVVFRPHLPISFLRCAPDVSSGEAQFTPCLFKQLGIDRARL